MFVRGTLELQEYEGKDGKNHTSVKLLANKVLALGKRDSNGQAAAASSNSGAATATAASPITDEDIPF